MEFPREAIVNRIDELHGAAKPAHLALVGPRGVGKTRIAERLVSRHAPGSTVFGSAVLVDLRSRPPANGAELIARVAAALRDALRREPSGALSWLADQISPDDASTCFDVLKLAVEEIHRAGQRWLVVLDGCDEPLGNPDVPRDAWENLRELGQDRALVYLTTSRAPLSELCSHDVRMSTFFGQFHHTPLWVGPLDDQDWIQLAGGHVARLDAGAIQALRRWTGGHPHLVETLLSVLPGRGVSGAHVDAGSRRLFDERCEVMQRVWHDCSLQTQQDLVRLAREPVHAAGWNADRVRALTLRGLAREHRDELSCSAELMRGIALQHQPGVEELGRLFGTADGFAQNIQRVLELRLAQVQGADQELLETVRFGVENVAKSPKACLSMARDIVDRALYLVWQAELPDGRVNQSWIEDWKFSGLTHEVDQYGRSPLIPEERGKQCGLLRLATGKQRTRAVTRRVTKATCVLIEHMQQLGDLKNHGQGVLPPTLAASFCLAAIELCESLARDLAGAAR